MNCERRDTLFADALEGLLDPGVRRDLESHLAACPACRAAWDETLRLVSRLEDDGRSDPPPSYVNAVMDRIVHEQASRLRRYALMKRVAIRGSIAAALLVAAAVALLHPAWGPNGGRAYADQLVAARRQMEQARSATWKIVFYQKLHGPGRGEARWFRVANNNQRYYFKAPGLYRRESLDETGQVVYVSVEDLANRSRLEVNYKEKTATLTPLGSAFESDYSPQGPFGWYLSLMGPGHDLQSLGRKDVAGRPANGFRATTDVPGDAREHTYDFWLDAVSKRLVTCQQPGAHVLDPAAAISDPAFDVSRGGTLTYQGKTFTQTRDSGDGEHLGGHVLSDIVFDPELDDSLFSLEPPKGFATRSARSPEITEKDVTEFLGVVAEYHGKTFPDRLPDFLRVGDELARYLQTEKNVMRKAEATPAETRLVESMHRWYATGIPGPGPLHVFIHRLITEGSWRYVGKGVALGDAGRVVAWYRPRGSKDYRVIHGDLSVKDVAAEDLPLPVGP